MAEMKKTLNLTGVTVNAMALIAPGAFLWITFQVQAAQVNTAGKTTAMDMFAGLFLALILAFLTAISYSMLAEKYPEAGTGSSYYFTEQAFLNEPSKLSAFSRLSKVIVGWFSHLYYWVYPGVMVAMMAVMIIYIFGQFGVNLSPFWQIVVAVVFSFAHRLRGLPRHQRFDPDQHCHQRDSDRVTGVHHGAGADLPVYQPAARPVRPFQPGVGGGGAQYSQRVVPGNYRHPVVGRLRVRHRPGG